MKNILRYAGMILLHILPLGLIALDLLFFNIGEVFAIVFAIVWIAAVNIFFFVYKKKRPVIFFCILDVIIIVFMFVASECNFYWNSESFRNTGWNDDSGNMLLTREQALDDYDFALKYLKKIHPLTLGGLPVEVEERAAEVKTLLESVDSITGYEFTREMESIFSMLGDGHTHVDEFYESRHYMKHLYEHKSAGDTLLGINGLTYEDMLQQNPYLVSYETEAYAVRLLKNRVTTLEGLRYLGIDTSGEITYNYLTEDGQYVDLTVTASDFLPMDEYLDYEESVTGDDLHGDDTEHDFVSFEIDEDYSLAVLTLDDCVYNEHYKDVVKEMFEEIHSRDIQNVVVDLSNNSGGSSLVADEFIHYLDTDEYDSWAEELRAGPFYIRHSADTDKNRKKGYGFSGNVYVITSVYSFSSAMDFAMLIQDNGLGCIVGEACGNMPASYGEIAEFKLPESGLYMQISSKKWHRIDETKEDLPILPDIECDPSDALDVIKEVIKGE